MRDWTSPKLAGLDSRLRSRNSETGLRLANREVNDCDLTPANLSDRFSLEVRMSMGICMRDMVVIWDWTGLDWIELENGSYLYLSDWD